MSSSRVFEADDHGYRYKRSARTFLLSDDRFCEASVRVVEGAAGIGSLVVCDIVYAELSIHFPEQPECDRFLDENEIRVESLSRPALFLASRA
jgi:hypothetical protein